MRTSQTPKNSVLLLWVALLGNAAANSPSASFSLGIPYGVNAASISYLHLSALEMAPKCDDANATMKSYRRLTEEFSTITNMIETTDAHTNVPAGSNKDTHTTSNDVEAGSQNNQPASQKRVYLGNENPEGCPTDIDTPFCHECGGDKGSPDGVSRCRGIAEQNMFLEDCLCEEVINNHSDPLKRPSLAERLRRWPEYEEVFKEIEEYGDEDEPIDPGQCSEAEVEVEPQLAQLRTGRLSQT
ncbi:hypothetical protein D6D01_09533 [Aureobasidium pullulans]|uniref:Uncharacterized protein n=1 Tax=Aureobasidium pullulans TaxID=5580 RepID=A0A4V4JRC1_AURPU|nr:hypothetical protein D6D01_09533 [Aureobasidium pullulans]